MRLLKSFLIGLILLFSLAAQAQPGQEWRVVVYESGTGIPGTGGILDVLGPSGIVARYALPASIFPADQPDAYPQLAVSSDLRYAAIAFSASNNGAPPISIIDLSTNSCCVTVTPPIANIQGYSLAGFNPQSTQLGLSYVALPDPNAYAPDGGLLVADAATGAIVGSLSLSQLKASTGAPEYTAFAQTGAWTAQGIRFAPSCWACEGVMESPWYTWDPATNLVGTVNNAYFTVFGDVLAGTGELLYNVNNTSYPSGPADGMFPPVNVVEYFQGGVPLAAPGGQQTNAPTAPVVYLDQVNLNFPAAQWVANGAAFLVRGGADGTAGLVVFRNQTRLNVTFGPTDRFLVGTPDGWLTQDSSGLVKHYVVANNAVNAQPLGQLAPNASAVWSTPLGIPGQPPFSLVAGVPFTPTVAPPPQLATPTIPPPPVAAGCLGAPAPRLTVGGQGRVTPGTPNNLRSSPSLTAALLGQIPAGGVFTVVSGPACSNAVDNITWWGVNYNGKLGYTAEGKGSEYWVEPVG